jgi:transposase
MPRVNKYESRSNITEAKFRQLVKLITIDLDASQLVQVTGLDRNTENQYLIVLRLRVAELCEQQADLPGFFGPFNS